MTAIELNGERLLLDHRRALVWPRRRAAFVADPHFGKSAVFRREGIALPEGSDDADLVTLAALATDHGVETLYILGDFVHGALPRSHRFYRRFNDWMSGSGLAVHVVLGNHDRYLDRQQLEGVVWHQRLTLDPFELLHDPGDAGTGYFLAGHIHPVFRISTRSDSLRMPVFWQREDGLVLPSFGAMTGGYAIRVKPSERLYGLGPDSVVDLSAN